MHRTLSYPGQIPLAEDFLSAQRYALVGIGELTRAVMGTPTVVGGLAVTPTTPASLAVLVAPGSLYQLASVDALDYSVLAADVLHQTMLQGILSDARSLTLTPPTTAGQAINYLIQAAFQSVDDTPLLLDYYNPDAPTQPYSGPNNSGVPDNTVRRGNVVVSAKAGLAAIAGTQTSPAPDPGYVALAVVTVAQGATQLTSAQIVSSVGSPYLLATLPQVPAAVQAGAWTSAQDTGTANAMVAAFVPAITQLKIGMALTVKKGANANTGAVTLDVGTGASAVVKANGAAMSANDLPGGMEITVVWDGSCWQTPNYLGIQSSTDTVTNNYTVNLPYGADGGAANHVVVAPTPAFTAPVVGDLMKVKFAAANTGAVDIAVNGLAAVPLRRRDGGALLAGALAPGMMGVVMYDGTAWQLVDAQTTAGFAPGSHGLRLLGSAVNSSCVALTNPIRYGFYTGETPDGLPTIADGTEVLSLTVTPSSATSEVLLHLNGFAHAYSGFAAAAIFRGTTCIKVVPISGITGGNWISEVSALVRDAPASAAPVTYSVRVGSHNASYPCALNGYVPGSGMPGGAGNNVVTHMFGSAGKTTLDVHEIL